MIDLSQMVIPELVSDPEDSRKTTTSRLSLSTEEVHLWRTSVDLSVSEIHVLKNILSPGEIKRAKGFHFEKDRIHFIAARGILRVILSRYLSRLPENIDFCYQDNGKPELKDTEPSLHFNVSHSGSLALYAVTSMGRVGIDIEYLRPVPDVENIVRTNFTPAEYAEFCSLPERKRDEAFLCGWTRKEAFLKATGIGLSHSPGYVEVNLTPGKKAKLLSIKGNIDATKPWILRTLFPTPGYVGAIATEGKSCRLKWMGEQLSL